VLCSGLPSCPSCLVNEAPRWQGYLLARGRDTENVALVQFSAGVVDNLVALKRPSDSILGLRLCFTRCGPRVNSPLTVTGHGFEEVAEPWPLARLEHILLRLLESNGRKICLDLDV